MMVPVISVASSCSCARWFCGAACTGLFFFQGKCCGKSLQLQPPEHSLPVILRAPSSRGEVGFFSPSVFEGFRTINPNRKCRFIAITRRAELQRGVPEVGDQNAILVPESVTLGRVACARSLLLLPPLEVLSALVTAEREKKKKKRGTL